MAQVSQGWFRCSEAGYECEGLPGLGEIVIDQRLSVVLFQEEMILAQPKAGHDIDFAQKEVDPGLEGSELVKIEEWLR